MTISSGFPLLHLNWEIILRSNCILDLEADMVFVGNVQKSSQGLNPTFKFYCQVPALTDLDIKEGRYVRTGLTLKEASEMF